MTPDEYNRRLVLRCRQAIQTIRAMPAIEKPSGLIVPP
jgi:hypothetical protein